MSQFGTHPGGLRPPVRRVQPVRRAGPRSLLLLLLVAGLAVLAFLQARHLTPWLLSRRAASVPVIPEVNLPEREIPVLVSDGDPAFLLKTTTDLPEADRLESERLDRLLFPEGPPHRYWILVARHDGSGDVPVDLDAASILIVGAGGEEWRPSDLSAALRERAPDLPPWLAAWLRLRVPGGPEVVLREGGARRLLLAFPAAATPETARGGRVGETALVVRTMTKDALDRRLDRRDDDGEARAP